MSVPFCPFQIVANQGSYIYEVSSCNPDQPVAFMGPGSGAFDYNIRKVCGDLGVMGSPTLAGITAFPLPPFPASSWNQNPIKVVISTVTTGEGEYTGNTAVLYGYFLKPYAEGLGFYLNNEQSFSNGHYGSPGFSVRIDPIALSIILG